MASNAAALEKEERLKNALWYAVGKQVEDECLKQQLNYTPEFVGALTELVYTQIANTSRDLETFAKHAGRKMINTDDVMLLSRRNEGLETMLTKILNNMKAAARATDTAPSTSHRTKRGRPSGVGAGTGVVKVKGRAK